MSAEDTERQARMLFWNSLSVSERKRLAQCFADSFGVKLHPPAVVAQPVPAVKVRAATVKG